MSRAAFFGRKVGRHLGWARTEGLGRLIEEDDLNPVDRVRQWWIKARWRYSSAEFGTARPVLVVGLQRSGTNMIVRGLDRAPEFEIRNENDLRAFRRYRLVPDDQVEAIILSSRHSYILFKPLCDSHRVDEMLDRWGQRFGGRALWAYRSVDGRVRSAVAKFGDDDRTALTAIADGTGSQHWQAGRLSPTTVATIRGLTPAALSPESASALFWWARNSLYFDLALDQRPDVALLSYDSFVNDPEGQMRRICDFLDLAYRPELIAHVDDRSGRGPAGLEMDARVRALCDELTARLGRRATAGQ